MTRPTGDLVSADGFDPTLADVRRDPYPYYRWLLRDDPVHQGAHGVWYVTRFDDVRSVLTDGRFERAGIRDFWQDLIGPGPLTAVVRDVILFQDDPDHRRLRDVIGAVLTPAALRRLEPRIHRIVDDVLAVFGPRGEMDVINDLAYPLALTVICEILGLDNEDYERLRRWSLDIGRTLDRAIGAAELSRGHTAILEFADYLSELILCRPGEHRAGLLGTMLAGNGGNGRNIRLTEVVGTVVTLVFTGNETVANQIGNGLLALLRNHDQLRLLRAEPERMTDAVEECVRFDPSIQSNSRSVGTDVELGGRTLRRGDFVVVLTAAANRDSRRFPRPDSFDITRERVQSMSFGAGMRYCLGALLARLELRVALDRLARLEEVALAVPTDELVYQPSTMFRGLDTLPITFRPTA